MNSQQILSQSAIISWIIRQDYHNILKWMLQNILYKPFFKMNIGDVRYLLGVLWKTTSSHRPRRIGLSSYEIYPECKHYDIWRLCSISADRLWMVLFYTMQSMRILDCSTDSPDEIDQWTWSWWTNFYVTFRLTNRLLKKIQQRFSGLSNRQNQCWSSIVERPMWAKTTQCRKYWMPNRITHDYVVHLDVRECEGRAYERMLYWGHVSNGVNGWEKNGLNR